MIDFRLGLLCSFCCVLGCARSSGANAKERTSVLADNERTPSSLDAGSVEGSELEGGAPLPNASSEVGVDGESAQGEVPAIDVTVLPGQWGKVAVAPNGSAFVLQPAGDRAYFTVRNTLPSGQEVWAASLPAFNYGGVVALNDEACAVFGGFQGTLQMGVHELHSVENPISSAGSAVDPDEGYGRGFSSMDGFVARLDAGGEVSWVKPFSGFGGQRLQAATLLPSGQLLVLGEFVADLSAGPLTLRNANGGSEPRSFLALMDLDGNVTRLTQFAGNNPQYIAANAGGAVVANHNDLGDGTFEFVVTRIGANGESAGALPPWSTKAGDLGGLALDEEGNIYLGVAAGDFHEELFFGELLYNEYAIAKVDPAGTLLWLRRFAGYAYPEPTLALQGTRLGVAGGFREQTDLGGGPLTSRGERDVFFAEFDLDGNHRYSLRFGGREDDVGNLLLPFLGGWAMDFSLNSAVALGPEQVDIPLGEHLMWLHTDAP